MYYECRRTLCSPPPFPQQLSGPPLSAESGLAVALESASGLDRWSRWSPDGLSPCWRPDWIWKTGEIEVKAADSAEPDGLPFRSVHFDESGRFQGGTTWNLGFTWFYLHSTATRQSWRKKTGEVMGWHWRRRRNTHTHRLTQSLSEHKFFHGLISMVFRWLCDFPSSWWSTRNDCGGGGVKDCRFGSNF